MPAYYDIYGLSKQRDKKTIEKFLNYYSYREKIETREVQEIAVRKNDKYGTEETWKTISNLSEVIDFGLENDNHGFVFYIADNLKEGIKHIILKFTFDGKIIFGISVPENIVTNNGRLIDNYDKALEVEQSIAELTNAAKTSIQFEYPPSDDEQEFDQDLEVWKNMNAEKRAQKHNR